MQSLLANKQCLGLRNARPTSRRCVRARAEVVQVPEQYKQVCVSPMCCILWAIRTDARWAHLLPTLPQPPTFPTMCNVQPNCVPSSYNAPFPIQISQVVHSSLLSSFQMQALQKVPWP
jgi:hypothetical protein